jgi:hypothetical protein
VRRVDVREWVGVSSSCSYSCSCCWGEGGHRTGLRVESARWMEERRAVCDEIRSGVGVDDDEGIAGARWGKTGVYSVVDIAAQRRMSCGVTVPNHAVLATCKLRSRTSPLV